MHRQINPDFIKLHTSEGVGQPGQGVTGSEEKDVDEIVRDEWDHELDEDAAGLLPAQHANGGRVDGQPYRADREVGHAIQVEVKALVSHVLAACEALMTLDCPVLAH